MLLPKKEAQYRQTILRGEDKCVYVKNAEYKPELIDRRNLIAKEIKQHNNVSTLFTSNQSILKKNVAKY